MSIYSKNNGLLCHLMTTTHDVDVLISTSA